VSSAHSGLPPSMVSIKTKLTHRNIARIPLHCASAHPRKPGVIPMEHLEGRLINTEDYPRKNAKLIGASWELQVGL